MNKNTTTNTNTNETVQSLRAKNYKVKVSHQRMAFNKQLNYPYPIMVPQWIVTRNHENWDILNGGGATIVMLTDPEGNHAEGTSICVEPNFDRKRGLKIALQRALQNL